MPNKRHARKTHRDAVRMASTGDLEAALTGFNSAARDYRAHLASRPTDHPARTELAELLASQAAAHRTAGDPASAATALTEQLTHLRELGLPRGPVAAVELDLAEAHLGAGRILTAATGADNAIRSYDRRDAAGPEHPGFTELATALARNARILHRTADPDLSVGAADQAARMLMATPGIENDPARLDHLRSALSLAIQLHTAAGRNPLATGARRLFARYFPGTEPHTAPSPPPLTLRASLEAAAASRILADVKLIDRLCPDPAGHAAPPAISARCDPGLATVALHALSGTVDALRTARPHHAWRVATEIHYLLTAADRQGERNLRLNFRDHGPVWAGMLLALADTAPVATPLAADLAGVLSGLLDRLHSRHAVDDRSELVMDSMRFIKANPGPR